MLACRSRCRLRWYAALLPMADLGNPLFLSSHPVVWLGNGALSPKSEYLRFRQRNDQVLSGTGCMRASMPLSRSSPSTVSPASSSKAPLNACLLTDGDAIESHCRRARVHDMSRGLLRQMALLCPSLSALHEPRRTLGERTPNARRCTECEEIKEAERCAHAHMHKHKRRCHM